MAMDLLIKNGHVIDTAAGVDGIASIGVTGDKVCLVADEKEKAAYVVDAAGCYVFPGLIDFHAHIYWGGSGGGVNPDLMLAHGVTTVVDAGSVGCSNFEAFYKSVVTNSQIRVRTHLSLYPAGQPGCGIIEDFSPEMFHEGRMAGLIERYREQIAGLKIRMGAEVVGDGNLTPLIEGVKLAERLGLPMIAHSSNPPVDSTTLINVLRTGDVFCHCFHGKGRTILDENGKVQQGVKDAKKRGVVFDACNGFTNFSIDVAKAALADGVYPDIISTDETQTVFNKNGLAKNLPYIMSKYLTLGLSLKQIVKAATEAPAKMLGMEGEIGTLKPGSRADIAIFKLAKAGTTYTDNLGRTMKGDVLLIPQMTIMDGQIAYSQVDF